MSGLDQVFLYAHSERLFFYLLYTE